MAGDADLTKSINNIGNIEERREAIILELKDKKAKIEAMGHEFSFLNLWTWIPDENGVTPMHVMLNDKILDRMAMASVITERGESILSTKTTRRAFIAFLSEIMNKLSQEDKLDAKEIVSLVQELNARNKKKDTGERDDVTSIQKRITELLEPIYIEMRLLGFSDYDMVK
ncbi:MAG TPA: hypothetical protein VJH06_04235 [Candidatus Paceibacterota bacterium]